MATSFAGRLVYGYVSGGIASEATGGNFLMGAATGVIVSLANHWLHGGGEQNAKWDTNGDGKLQKSEADNYWINGNGEDINVDNSNID